MNTIKNQKQFEMVVIGASAGGVEALMYLLPKFKSSSLSVAVVLHLPPYGKNLLPSLVGPDCEYTVKEALPGELVAPKTIYIASPNYHLCLEPDNTISLSSEELLNFSRPSIDILFDSAAYAYKERLIGILLTGANNDGAAGLKMIQDQGGYTVVQDPHGIDYPTMPQAAINVMNPDLVLNLEKMGAFISSSCIKGKSL